MCGAHHQQQQELAALETQIRQVEKKPAGGA
jgi:hypothetical protein